MKKEEWKIIKGYEDYMVSNWGNIKSYRGRSNGLIMSPNKTQGYLFVSLCNDQGKKRHSIHRLVATHFIENPNGLPFINHKNGIRDDNRVENLEWCTPSQNTRHYFYVLKEGQLLKDQPVVQYTKTGRYIQDWDSVIEASMGTGIHIDDIIHSCKRRQKRKTTKGYLWRFRGDLDLRLEYKASEQREYFFRGVVRINKYGEKVGEYGTIQEASKYTGVNACGIQKVCANKQWKTEDGSIWRYAELFDENEFGYYKDKTFIKMTPLGIFVEKYKGIHELIDNTNGDLVSFIRCFKGDLDSIDRYKWCVEEEGDKSRKEKRRHPVVCLDKQMNYICEYPTVSAAAVAMKCQPIHVSIACRDIKRSCRGYRWMYKDEYDKSKDI